MMAVILAMVALLLTACGGASPTVGPSPIPAPTPAPAPPPPPPVVLPDGFDEAFYRQFALGTLDGPAQPLRILPTSPSIYLQTTGLQPATVAAYEAAARAVVPALTGGRLSVTAWETGPDVRSERAGWIVTELVNDANANCGRSMIGAAAGHVWINTAEKCHRNGDRVATASVFAHELGHALGFYHIDRDGLMRTPVPPDAAPTALERLHGAYAYAQR